MWTNLNWKLMWACFFGGMCLPLLLGAIFGSGVATVLLVLAALFSIGLVGWNWVSKEENGPYA